MEKLYIIQGTGLCVDGTVVKIVEVVGDYSIVSPPNLDDTKNIMIKNKCLRPFCENKPIVYTVEIVKYVDQKRVDEGVLDIPRALRDVPISTILEYLESNLVPILRME